MSDFIVLYPGVYAAKEKALAESYLADNKAIAERGPIDIQALISGRLPKGTPGVGPTIVVTEAMVRYNNQKYDPENPILNDAAYARKLGYQDIPAYPTFGGHDDTYMIPWPPAARDTLLVSGLNHSITSYKPVFPGDTLYLVIDARQVADLTPTEGSIYRFIAIQSEGSLYNQKGEKVNDVIFRVTEGVKIYKDDSKRPKNPTFADIWEAPNWMERPAHYYTDEDWEFIKGLWAREKRRGAEPLYWEEVKIGDEPGWTVDGPVEESVTPTPPWGMGIGGSRSNLKEEIMDPAIFKTLVRSEKDGIYRLPNREDQVPPIPDGVTIPKPPAKSDDGAISTVDIHKATETRAALINFMGRDMAIRHINNWMGDHGWLHNIRWGIMPPESHAAYGKTVPQNPQAERFLEKIPEMKGKHTLAHGLTGDLAVIKSCVYDKYVRDGQFLVELGWWVETIEGDIWEDGGATVRLPSKRAQ